MSGDRITSTANPLVKDLTALSSRRGRERAGAFLFEGHREVGRALVTDLDIDLVLVCPELLGDRPALDSSSIRVQHLGEAAFRKISRRQNPDGIAARATTPPLDLASLSLPADPLVLVAERIEKPGNLGAMVRTAAALGIDAVVLAEPSADVYSPNTIRSSQGAVFSMPLATATTADVISWLEERQIRIVAGHPDGGTALWDAVIWNGASPGGIAVVVGAEAHGLSSAWTDHSVNVTIPMRGGAAADSLNAATAASILLYEAVRQRT